MSCLFRAWLALANTRHSWLALAGSTGAPLGGGHTSDTTTWHPPSHFGLTLAQRQPTPFCIAQTYQYRARTPPLGLSALRIFASLHLDQPGSPTIRPQPSQHCCVPSPPTSLVWGYTTWPWFANVPTHAVLLFFPPWLCYLSLAVLPLPSTWFHMSPAETKCTVSVVGDMIRSWRHFIRVTSWHFPSQEIGSCLASLPAIICLSSGPAP